MANENKQTLGAIPILQQNLPTGNYPVYHPTQPKADPLTQLLGVASTALKITADVKGVLAKQDEAAMQASLTQLVKNHSPDNPQTGLSFAKEMADRKDPDAMAFVSQYQKLSAAVFSDDPAAAADLAKQRGISVQEARLQAHDEMGSMREQYMTKNKEGITLYGLDQAVQSQQFLEFSTKYPKQAQEVLQGITPLFKRAYEKVQGQAVAGDQQARLYAKTFGIPYEQEAQNLLIGKAKLAEAQAKTEETRMDILLAKNKLEKEGGSKKPGANTPPLASILGGKGGDNKAKPLIPVKGATGTSQKEETVPWYFRGIFE